MNVTDYSFLINKPSTINEKQTEALQGVLEEFPYFQSARALRLKGLFSQNSFKYNFALKVTAAHTTDRTILFDFITSEGFTAIQKELYDKKNQELLDIIVIDSVVLENKATQYSPLETAILSSIKEAAIHDVKPIQTAIETKLDLGKPLDFTASEKHSFQEWLQLSRTAPIIRENETSPATNELNLDPAKKKKIDLIDKFIETSPKIPPVKQGTATNVTLPTNSDDQSYLMTETLARVYLEQKKYQRAIQAYEILILKYPEKSSFFANHITEIKILQNNNN
ncbi:tetratricopeptide repeat protein [Flavobacterium restrictum]|uniref:Tetratricopeptide repeat protein n=1 Tax=Flavobacterium restrictum TaxID=2594428 RepID=A0A553EAW6_9FLAO|nr:tetratricopeptide repeat protein [Flavobacterium restrictum]TRX42214.1 hypothetical protein FNW21_02835 [Flavobacterium restrictum]